MLPSESSNLPSSAADQDCREEYNALARGGTGNWVRNTQTYGWRLRFPDEETASLWINAVSSLNAPMGGIGGTEPIEGGDSTRRLTHHRYGNPPPEDASAIGYNVATTAVRSRRSNLKAGFLVIWVALVLSIVWSPLWGPNRLADVSVNDDSSQETILREICNPSPAETRVTITGEETVSPSRCNPLRASTGVEGVLTPSAEAEASFAAKNWRRWDPPPFFPASDLESMPKPQILNFGWASVLQKKNLTREIPNPSMPERMVAVNPKPQVSNDSHLGQASALEIVSIAISEFADTSKLFLAALVVSMTSPSTQDLPPQVQTIYRKIILHVSEHFSLNFSSLLTLFAASIMLVSASSIVYQTFPSLTSVLWSWRHWISAAACLMLVIILGQDTYENHWRLPLRYGLYWNGWAQTLVATGTALAGNSALQRALGRPAPRYSLSTARKASAALSGIVLTLSVPLALRSTHEGSHSAGGKPDRVFAARLCGTSALVAFHVGLYFLGRAVREITAFNGRFPVGLCIHRLSLLPAWIAYATLSSAGDAARRGMVLVRRVVCPSVEVCVSLARMCAEHSSPLTSRGMIWVVALAEAIVSPPLTVLRYFVASSFRLALAAKETWHQVASPFLRQIYTILMRSARKLMQWTRLGQRFVYNKIVKPASRAFCYSTKALSELILLLTDALNRLLQSCLNAVKACLEFMKPLCRIMHESVHRIALQYIYPTLVPAFAFLRGATMAITRNLYNAVITLICLFVQKYWQLIPAGLVINGSLTFASFAVKMKDSGLLVQAEYALGSWALLLIGITVLKAVLFSQRNFVSQHVVLKESILWHVDLHFPYAFNQVILSGWNALSTVLKLILHSVDIAVRETFRFIWKLLHWLHNTSTKPMFRTAKNIFLFIWISPYLSLLLSLFTLYILHLRHVGAIALTLPEFWKIFANGQAYGFLTMEFPTSLWFYATLVQDKLLHSSPMLIVSRVYGDVYDPFIH